MVSGRQKPDRRRPRGHVPRQGRRAVSVAVGVVLVLLGGCQASTPAPVHALPLRLVRDVQLPGGSTRLDYQALDPAGRLYIAHLGDGTVDVVDLTSASVVGTVSDVSSVHGVALAPDRHVVLAAAAGTDEVAAIDAKSLRVSARFPAGGTPDGIAYDPVHRKAYVSNETGRAETVIDLGTTRALAPVELDGAAGNSVFDPVGGQVYVNIRDRDELVTIDPSTDTITTRIGLSGCQSNHGLLVDGTRQLAFVACQDNATLLVVDLRTRQVTARFPTGRAPDVLAYDEGLHRLYVASESGVVSVFQQNDRSLHLLASAALARAAHTVAVDPATHRVYLPLENVGGHPVLRIMEPTS